MNDTSGTDIRIDLPLPLDISGTLIQVIGLTYPGAVIKNSGHKWDHERQLVLSIPDADRHKSPKKAEKYAKVKAHLEANADGLLTELGANGASLGIPEHLGRIMLALGQSWVAMYPDAANYVEVTVRDRETNKDWVFYVARSEKQTPHALRRAAESERDELRAELDATKAKLEATLRDTATAT